MRQRRKRRKQWRANADQYLTPVVLLKVVERPKFRPELFSRVPNCFQNSSASNNPELKYA